MRSLSLGGKGASCEVVAEIREDALRMKEVVQMAEKRTGVHEVWTKLAGEAKVDDRRFSIVPSTKQRDPARKSGHDVVGLSEERRAHGETHC